MKRTLAFIMALALVLSLSISAFAAGTGSITITNATEGETYSVYKIFDAVYEGDKVAYTLNDGELEAVMFGENAVKYNESKAADFFDFDATTKVVTLKDDADEAKMFKYLGELVKGDNVTAADTQIATGATVEFTGLDTGYYVIDRQSGSANGVTITTTKPHADVVDKNRLPSDLDKTTEQSSVSVGDTINWTLELTASNYNSGEKIVTYTIWDKLTPDGWATIDTDSIKVYVNNEEISAWSLVEDDTVDFKIDIPWAITDENGEFVAFKYDAVVTIKVTYSATVKDEAAANDPTQVQNKNSADFNYDTEVRVDVPGNGDETETEVYNMGFTKVDGDTDAGLAGAEFELYDAEGNRIQVSETETAGVYIVDKNGNATITSPANGKVVIMGLAAGTYTLKETKAPDGYNKLAVAQSITVATVANDDTYDYTVTDADNNEVTVSYTVFSDTTIENFSGVELPSTGGMGTVMLLTFGTMVAMAFGVLMITQKKMSIYRD